VREKAFIVSVVISVALLSLWGLAFKLFGTRLGGSAATILIACLGVVITFSVLVASVVFKERRLSAVCGALAGSCSFLSVIAVLVAWHHHLTTGP
jgi:hypothetical protein